MKKSWIVFTLALMFTCGLSTSAVSKEQKLVKCKVKDKSLRSVKYRIAHFERSVLDNGLPNIAIDISVEPENINREFLMLLAQHLKQRFCHEERLVVAIFVDHIAAKYFDPSFPKVLDAWRGEYFLDRRSGEEYISYTAIPNYNNNPQARVRIDLGTKNTP